mmetsp:Transcript_26784/g.77238  ORF Transcript_26784/g.77238 Transcript_26784/m.77238 type:complete len:209 (-) Transcript_26784:257-883(-)
MRELNLNILAKARRVVIANRSCISKRLQDGIGLQYLLLNVGLVTGISRRIATGSFARRTLAKSSQILHNEFGADGLTGTTLSTNNHTLIDLDVRVGRQSPPTAANKLQRYHHISIGPIGETIHMRCEIIFVIVAAIVICWTPLAPFIVPLHCVFRIQSPKSLERIDRQQCRSSGGVDLIHLVSLPKTMNDGRFVQMCQRYQIIRIVIR